MKLIGEEIILEQWKPMLESKTEVKDSYKLDWLSKYCHFHAMNESINENYSYGSAVSLNSVPGMGSVSAPANPGGVSTFYTGQTGSGDKFPTLLPLAIQVATRTIGFDIVSVIPMSGPTGMLAYMDYVYAGGEVGSTTKPLAIKINADKINSTDYVVGTTYWGCSAASDGTNFASTVHAVELSFVGYSKIDGYPIFRVGTTYTCTGTGGAITADTTVTLSQVFDEAAVIVTNNAGVPTVTNLTADTIAVTAKAQLVRALEDQIQGYTGSGTYDQDVWSGPFATGQLPQNPMGRGTGENTYYRSMGLKLFSKFVEAETSHVSASVKTEQIQDLNKQWGIDAVAMVENALINEIAQSINKHILSRAFALGWTNNASMYKTEGVTLNFTIDRTVVADGTSPAYLNKIGFTQTLPYRKFQDFGDFENLDTLHKRIFTKVLGAKNIINIRGKKGPGNFIVTNAQIATAFQSNAQYTFAPITNSIAQDNDLFPVGVIAGMTVYVDPTMRWDDNRILVGRKGPDDDPGLKFCPYLMAETISTIAEGTMSPKIAVKSRYALVEAGHWPETMYYTIHLHVGTNDLIV